MVIHRNVKIGLLYLAVLLALEFVARAFFYWEWQFISSLGQDPQAAGPILPSQRFVDRVRSDMPFYIRSNALGTRNTTAYAWTKPKNTFRILALGDSFTYGVHVSNFQTWPEQLETLLLRKHGIPSEVLNLGMSGYTLDDEYRLLIHKAIRTKPDLLVVAYYVNDIADFSEAHKKVFVPEPPPTWRRVGLRHVKTLLKQSALISAWRYYRAWALARRLGRDARRFDREMNDQADLPPAELKRCRALYLDYLRKLLAFTRARQIPVLFVFIPQFTELEADRPRHLENKQLLQAELERQGVNSLDLLPALRQAGDASLLYLIPQDMHMSQQGYRVVAKQIAAVVQKDYVHPGPVLGPQNTGQAGNRP